MSGPRERLEEEQRRTAARLAALRGDHRGFVDASRDTNADDEHDPEGATIAFEREQVAALLAQARRRVEELRSALERNDAGVYGRCEACGRPIGAARLEARPTARTCIACAARRR